MIVDSTEDVIDISVYPSRVIRVSQFDKSNMRWQTLSDIMAQHGQRVTDMDFLNAAMPKESYDSEELVDGTKLHKLYEASVARHQEYLQANNLTKYEG